MRNNSKSAQTQNMSPSQGRNTWLPFEVANESQANFLEQVSCAVQPRDFIEKYWVGVCARLMWEYARVARLKARLDGLARAETFAHLQLAGAPQPFEDDDIEAQTLLVNFAEHDKIERYLAGLRDQLDKTLMMVERRRLLLASQLRVIANRVASSAAQAEVCR